VTVKYRPSVCDRRPPKLLADIFTGSLREA
jgi:hypothetical protein